MYVCCIRTILNLFRMSVIEMKFQTIEWKICAGTVLFLVVSSIYKTKWDDLLSCHYFILIASIIYHSERKIQCIVDTCCYCHCCCCFHFSISHPKKELLATIYYKCPGTVSAQFHLNDGNCLMTF